MGCLGYIFFLVFFLVLGIIIKLFLGTYRLYSSVRNFAKKQVKPEQSDHKSRSGKKISQDVGEYVEYQEISVTETTTTDGQTTSYQVEEQITDVEWEEIPSSPKDEKR